jgi:hypothetical protein
MKVWLLMIVAQFNAQGQAESIRPAHFPDTARGDHGPRAWGVLIEGSLSAEGDCAREDGGSGLLRAVRAACER